MLSLNRYTRRRCQRLLSYATFLRDTFIVTTLRITRTDALLPSLAVASRRVSVLAKRCTERLLVYGWSCFVGIATVWLSCRCADISARSGHLRGTTFGCFTRAWFTCRATLFTKTLFTVLHLGIVVAAYDSTKQGHFFTCCWRVIDRDDVRD